MSLFCSRDNMQISWNFRKNSQILGVFFKAPAEKPEQIFISRAREVFRHLVAIKWAPFELGHITKFFCNRPRSVYQYSNMAPRLSGQSSIFDGVFFVSKSLLGIERQKKPRKPRSHVRVLIYRTWPIIDLSLLCNGYCQIFIKGYVFA